MLKKIIIFIFFFSTIILYGEIKDPKDPDDPYKTFKLEGENNIDDSTDKSDKQNQFNVKYLNNNGILKTGIIKDITGFYLKLSWDENQSGLQEILIDFVESIRIKGYKMEKNQ